jgi:hypothetical protein
MVCRQKKDEIFCDDTFFSYKKETNLKIKNVHVIYLDILTNVDNFTPTNPQIYLR